MAKRRRYVIHLNPSHIDMGPDSTCEFYILSPVRAFLYSVVLREGVAASLNLTTEAARRRALVDGGLEKVKEELDRVTEEDLVIEIDDEIADPGVAYAGNCPFRITKGRDYVCSAHDYIEDSAEGLTDLEICKTCDLPKATEVCRFVIGINTTGVADETGVLIARQASAKCQISQDQVLAECRPGYHSCWSFFYEVPVRRR